MVGQVFGQRSIESPVGIPDRLIESPVNLELPVGFLDRFIESIVECHRLILEILLEILVVALDRRQFKPGTVSRSYSADDTLRPTVHLAFRREFYGVKSTFSPSASINFELRTPTNIPKAGY